MPSNLPVNEENTLTCWTFFQKHRWVSPEFTHSVIHESWQRCIRQCSAYEWQKPNIASGNTLRSFLSRNSEIIAISETVLEDVYRMLEPKECALFLTDATGCTLTILGDKNTILEAQELGFKLGSFWTEGKIGTNAISLSLYTHESESVFSAQHFNKNLHAYACHASPIFDIDGQLKACLLLFTNIKNYQQSDAALISSCAKEVSSVLQLDSSLSDSSMILNQRNAVFECMDDGIIAWDKDLRITLINDQAASKFKLKREHIVGSLLHKIIMLPPSIKLGIKNKTKLSHLEITFESQGEFIEALVTLRPLNDGGFLFFIHPLETIRRFAQRNIGNNIELSFDSFVVFSKKMKKVQTIAKRAAKSSNPILLRGEEGVGKHKIAQAMHYLSENRAGPFLTVNCKDIAQENMSRELLGSDEGKGHASKFELANGGTIYLDQVEFLCAEVQVSLLQMLKTNLFTRQGSDRIIPVNFQLITSTSADLELYVKQGTFRRHLYYTISSVELNIPPLRHRKEDIIELIKRQILRLEHRYNTSLSISDEAIQILSRYSWPGNMSELKNKMEKIVLNRANSVLGISDLPQQLLNSNSSGESVAEYSIQSLETVEKQAIQQAWDNFDGRINEIAHALEIGRTTLWRKLKKYKIS